MSGSQNIELTSEAAETVARFVNSTASHVFLTGKAGTGKTTLANLLADKLRPGELGTLIDFEANPLDVTATIIDLAVRGFLTIEEIKTGATERTDWSNSATGSPSTG